MLLAPEPSQRRAAGGATSAAGRRHAGINALLKYERFWNQLPSSKSLPEKRKLLRWPGRNMCSMSISEAFPYRMNKYGFTLACKENRALTLPARQNKP
jgi:hypothetical protein